MSTVYTAKDIEEIIAPAGIRSPRARRDSHALGRDALRDFANRKPAAPCGAKAPAGGHVDPASPSRCR
jgi:hypothetical protein